MLIGNNLRIRKEREEKHISQEEMAEILGIKSAKTYGRYENGLQEIPSDILIKMARYFNKSIDYLLGITDFTTDGNQYIHDSIGLSDKAINQLRKYKKADDNKYQIAIDSLKNNKPAPPTNMIFLHLPIINFLLSSASFQKFLERFFNYSIDWYQVPILKDGEQFKVFPSYENDTKDFLYFGCNPNNPLDNVSMEIDSDFRKTISKNLLELSLDDLAQEYKKLSKIEK